ncbi:MAG TPA: class I SAM-dependent methyltransferase [Thermoleophilaceae bacterium]|mgnify:CR=1 FL=1
MSREVHHPIFARFLAAVTERAEGTEEDEIRRELLAGLRGRVIEIGSGTGPNFRLYPDAVSELVAVEPEDYLRARAEEAAGRAGRPISVVDAIADELPFEDGSFDAAVAAQVLCSVPSQAAALAEIRRVLRPGGELRFYEHVVARQPRYARFQRLAGRVTPLLAGGCHPDRDTGRAIEQAGFTIERCRRFVFRPCLLDLPVAPRILGVARA